MTITFDNVIVFSLGGIAGYFVRIIIDHFLAKRRSKEDRKAKRFDEAARDFRRRILTELEGIYPITQFWTPEIYPKFAKSIIKIASAAVEFKHLIKGRNEFDAAVKEYREYCSKVTFEGVTAWHMYPTMRKPDNISPEIKFINIVENLLSFTERK